MPTEPSVQTVSTAVQCSSLSDGVPLRVAAGLVPLLSQPPTPNIFESDSEEEQDPVSDSDSDFDPMDEIDDASDDENQQELYPLRTNVNPGEEKQFIVSESCLATILGRCSTCNGECQSSVVFTRGTMIGTESVCTKGHVRQWESQKCHNRMPWSNLLLAGAVVFSGINFSKCLRFLKHLNVPAICPSTFNRIQSAYVVPATLFTWDFHQTELLDQYQGHVVTLGGDARCDSPGFSAKYGSYTLMDLELGKVVDFQLVQVIMNIIISHIISQYYKFCLRIRKYIYHLFIFSGCNDSHQL